MRRRTGGGERKEGDRREMGGVNDSPDAMAWMVSSKSRRT
jgi:hypothetical protein